MTKPQITVRIPQPLLDILNSYVEKTGTSKTEVVVSALSEYLDGTDYTPLNQRVAEVEIKMAKLEAEVKGKPQKLNPKTSKS